MMNAEEENTGSGDLDAPDHLGLPPSPSYTASPGTGFNATDQNITVVPRDVPSPAPPATEDMNKVISDTLAILKTQQDRIALQKTFLSQVSFILNKLREGLEQYNGITEKLNTFLVHNEKRQSEMYANYCRWCPSYGDYVEALADTTDKIEVEGFATPVAQKELRALADDVAKVFYASGIEVKNHRMVCKAINNHMPRRRLFYVEKMKPFPSWFHLLNTEMENQNALSDELFHISAFIDFVKAEDNHPIPELDLSHIGDGKVL